MPDMIDPEKMDSFLGTLRENWGDNSGWACVFAGPQNVQFYEWPKDADRMYATINELDSSNINSDRSENVYVSWCLFDRPSRKAEFASVLPGLFLDIDLSTGCHSKKNLPESQDKALSLVESSNLPGLTRVLHSGGGLYGHLLFDEPFLIKTDLDRKRANIVLAGLTRTLFDHFENHGFHLDNVADLARITRFSGMTNFKYDPPAMVFDISLEGPRHSLSELENIVILGGSSEDLCTAPSIEPRLGESDTLRGDFKLVEENCAFARQMGQSPASFSEPEWKAVATIAAHCENGHERFHTLSAADQDRYSRQETSAKLDQSRSVAPRTCKNIEQSLGFSDCQRCPFKASRITSPYGLAFGDPELLVLQRDYVFSSNTDTYHCVSRKEPELSEKSFNNQFADWIKVPHKRFVQDKRSPKVKLQGYRPGDRSLITEQGDGVAALNMWMEGGVAASQGASDLLLDHIEYLASDEEQRSWFLNYLAHLVQFPAQKIKHAIILIGDQGVGKSLLNSVLAGMFGNENVMVDDSHIHASKFRRKLGNRQVLVVEEMATADKFGVSNDLKPWITSDYVEAEDKHIRSHSVCTPRGILIWTNHAVPIVLEPGERRYFVLRVDSAKREQEYYDRLHDEGMTQIPAFKQFLLNRDLSNWSSNMRPPMTEAKMEAQEASRTPIAANIQRAMENGHLSRELYTLDDIAQAIHQYCDYSFPQQGAIRKAMHELHFRKIASKVKLRTGNTADLFPKFPPFIR